MQRSDYMGIEDEPHQSEPTFHKPRLIQREWIGDNLTGAQDNSVVGVCTIPEIIKDKVQGKLRRVMIGGIFCRLVKIC